METSIKTQNFPQLKTYPEMFGKIAKFRGKALPRKKHGYILFAVIFGKKDKISIHVSNKQIFKKIIQMKQNGQTSEFYWVFNEN